MADAQYQLQDYEQAVWYYEAALSEMELHMGRGAAYQIVQENADHAYEKLGGKPIRKGLLRNNLQCLFQCRTRRFPIAHFLIQQT